MTPAGRSMTWRFYVLVSLGFLLLSGCVSAPVNPGPTQDAARQRAEKAFADQEWRLALSEYESVLAATPDDAEARERAIQSALRADLFGRAASHMEISLPATPPASRYKKLFDVHLAGAEHNLRQYWKRQKLGKSDNRAINRLLSAIDAYNKHVASAGKPRKKHARKSIRKHKPAARLKSAASAPVTKAVDKPAVKKTATQAPPPFPDWLKNAPGDSYTIQLYTAISQRQLDHFINEHGLPRKQLYSAMYRLNDLPHYVLLYGSYDSIAKAKHASQALPLSIKDIWIRSARSLRAFLKVADHS